MLSFPFTAIIKRHWRIIFPAVILLSVFTHYGRATTSFNVSRSVLPLSLPEVAAIDYSLYEPVAYEDKPLGEYIDVDLPDDIKQQKYGNATRQYKRQLTGRRFHIQAGVFKEQQNASHLQEELVTKELPDVALLEYQIASGNKRYLVRFGNYENITTANDALHLYNLSSNHRGCIIAE